MTNALVDSNILVYSLMNKDTEKKKTSLDLLESLLSNNSLVFCAQNLAESARVLTEKVNPPINKSAVADELKEISNSCNVLSYNSNTVLEALSISNDHKIHFFDALIAATMKENYLKVIYTENVEDFKSLPFIRAINPFK